METLGTVLFGTMLFILGALVLEEYVRAYLHDPEGAKHPVAICFFLIPAIFLIIGGICAIFGP